jgi:hypothetical protein
MGGQPWRGLKKGQSKRRPPPTTTPNPRPPEDEELWDCCLTLDPAPERLGGGRVTLRLSWRALEGMCPQGGAE